MYKILCVTTISQSTLYIVFNIAKVGGPHYHKHIHLLSSYLTLVFLHIYRTLLSMGSADNLY